MGEVTLKVPAEYTETLRRAVISEVDFWTNAIKQDLVEIQEAREGRPDPKAVRFRERDLEEHQGTLGGAGALVDQLPAPGAEVEAEVQATNMVLFGLAEEAQSVCIQNLAGQLEEHGPLDHPDFRRRLEEIGWWMSQEEQFSTNGKAV